MYIRAIQKHTGENMVAPELMGHVAIPYKWTIWLKPFQSSHFCYRVCFPMFCGSLIVGVVIGVVSILDCCVCAPSISLCCVPGGF